nr:MAG TPA_asm: hypothetical protein [Caudoviricetes sp.]
MELIREGHRLLVSFILTLCIFSVTMKSQPKTILFCGADFI